MPGVPMHNLPDLKEKRRPLWNYQIPMLTDWKSHQHRAVSSVQVKYWMLPGGKQVHRIDECGREEGDTRRKILDKEHPNIPNHRVMSIGCLRVLEQGRDHPPVEDRYGLVSGNFLFPKSCTEVIHKSFCGLGYPNDSHGK